MVGEPSSLSNTFCVIFRLRNFPNFEFRISNFPTRLGRLAVVDRRVLGQLFRRNLGGDLSADFDAHHAVVGHPADRDAVQVPFAKDLLDLFLAALLRDEQHPLLRFAEHDLVRRHARLAFRHEVQIDLVARAAAAGRLAGRTGQSRRAHVLDADDQPVLAHHFEAGFQQQLFHERIADLHRRPVLLRFLGQLARGERRARQPVPSRRAADVNHGVAHAASPCRA